MYFSGALTPERVAAMSLREQWLLRAQARVQAGLAPYDYTPGHLAGQEVRESAQTGAGEVEPLLGPDGAPIAVRESASMSDMPTLLGSQLYRQIDNWFAEYDGTWKKYSYQVDLVDFRPKFIAFINELEDAKEVRAERDIQDTGMLDKAYQIQLLRYARQITLPFTVIENDDKGFVKQIPQKMVNSADRTIQKIVVRNTLEANPNAYDGNALYGAARASMFNIQGTDSGATVAGNLVSGAASAFSATNLQAGIAAVQMSTGDPDLNPSGVPLAVPAKYIVCPSQLEFKVAQTLNSAFLLAAATTINNNPYAAGSSGLLTNTAAGIGPAMSTVGAQNPLQMGGFQTPITMLVERYLTNTAAWYLVPDADQGPITVGVRQGRGLRPRVWVNVPQRQALMGGSADEYLLSVSDVNTPASHGRKAA